MRIKFRELTTRRWGEVPCQNINDLHHRILGVYGLLIIFNLLVWLLSWYAFRHHVLLLGTALLAYSFGLRHAVDADHIVAIDNITRKLMQEGKFPILVGLSFSLGHSTIVLIISVGIFVASTLLHNQLTAFNSIGNIVGTLISALFLVLLATMNLFVISSLCQVFQKIRQGKYKVNKNFDALINNCINNRGLWIRLFRPIFRIISCSWHIYLLGILFGLGFDTATEIGVLGITTTEAANGLPFWTTLIFPALFMAGMTLVDTTDNVLMLGAYGWALTKPIRKLYYNLIITAISIFAALAIAGIEIVSLVASQANFKKGIWNLVARLNDNLNVLGFVIVGIFLATWLLALVIYRRKSYPANKEASSSKGSQALEHNGEVQL